MTNQNYLDVFLLRIINRWEERPNLDPEDIETLSKLLPKHESIWLTLGENYEFTYLYSRYYYLLEAKRKKDERMSAYIRGEGFFLDLNSFNFLFGITLFSSEGVEHSSRLEKLLLKQLGGQKVNLARYDRREIMFHKQQLFEAGLAKGHWEINGNIPRFELTGLTEKGHEQFRKIRMNLFLGIISVPVVFIISKFTEPTIKKLVDKYWPF